MVTEQPTASTSTQNQCVMTWYACGRLLPAGMPGGDDLQSDVLAQVKKCMPNLVPTTYEAADAYLREERKKPKGERDLLREMCVMIPLGLPKDRIVSFVVPRLKTELVLTDGTVIIFPTTDTPPDSFGTPENMGLLDSDKLMYNPPTHTPQKGIILLSYFTKSGPDGPSSLDSFDRIQVNSMPYA